MDICAEHHEEVCYEGSSCPVCDIREDMEDQIEALESTLSEARTEIDTLLEA